MPAGDLPALVALLRTLLKISFDRRGVMAEDEDPQIAAVLAKLAGQDAAAAEDARAALEWIAGDQGLVFITQQRGAPVDGGPARLRLPSALCADSTVRSGVIPSRSKRPKSAGTVSRAQIRWRTRWLSVPSTCAVRPGRPRHNRGAAGLRVGPVRRQERGRHGGRAARPL